MDLPVAHQIDLRIPRVRFARVVAVAAMAILAACSHHKQQTAEKSSKAADTKVAASSGGSGGFMTGGNANASDPNAKFVSPDAPKFAAPKSTGKGAPDLASVPTKAPKPPSSRQDRDKVTEGLVADRDHARYTDQGGRSTPVSVRPLTEAQAVLDPEPAAPPKPQAAQTGAVTRLGNQPAPSKAGTKGDALAEKVKTPAPAAPAEAKDAAAKPATIASAAQLAANTKAPTPPAEVTGPRPSNMPVARTDGFRPLGTYEATTSVSNQVASVDFAGTGTSIGAAGRRSLSEAAKLGERTKGAFRIVGRTSEPTTLVQERATAVARELQRLGVAQDRIFVGTDAGQDGRVDVILDQ